MIQSQAKNPFPAAPQRDPVSDCSATHPSDPAARWFAEGAEPKQLTKLGFKLGAGGIHMSKTIMLQELTALLAATAAHPDVPLVDLVAEHNVLSKATGTARRSTLTRLSSLYGVVDQPPVTRVIGKLWSLDTAGRPLLALLAALARDSVLRESAQVIAAAAPGTPVRWPDFARSFQSTHPGRWSEKMLKSMSQNCASTWTQTSHLTGFKAKMRSRPKATPYVAAYAALLAEWSGFGGPALVDSPWLAVTDLDTVGRIALLRDADSLGLLRLRTGGGIVEVAVQERIKSTLGI